MRKTSPCVQVVYCGLYGKKCPGTKIVNMKLRKRIENSIWLERSVSWALSSYLRVCMRTTKWNGSGRQELIDALRDGPVILVLWHSRLLYAHMHWPRDVAKISTLRNTSPAGRLAAATQARFGMHAFAMHEKKSNRSASREILRRVRDGTSLGLAADGPMGPAREMKSATTDWVRATGCPVFFYAFSVRGHKRLSTWDKMMLPLPFTKGAYVYRRWDGQVGRRATEAEIAENLQDMKTSLDAVQAETDAMIDLTPCP